MTLVGNLVKALEAKHPGFTMGSKSDDWGLIRRGEDAEPKGEKGDVKAGRDCSDTATS